MPETEIVSKMTERTEHLKAIVSNLANSIESGASDTAIYKTSADLEGLIKESLLYLESFDIGLFNMGATKLVESMRGARKDAYLSLLKKAAQAKGNGIVQTLRREWSTAPFPSVDGRGVGTVSFPRIHHDWKIGQGLDGWQGFGYEVREEHDLAGMNLIAAAWLKEADNQIDDVFEGNSLLAGMSLVSLIFVTRRPISPWLLT